MTGPQRILAIAMVVAYGDMGRALFENTLEDVRSRGADLPDTWEELPLSVQMVYIHRALALTAGAE